MDDRGAARLLIAFIATGLFFLALPGTFIGVGNLLLIATSHAPGAPAPGWIQAHGQAQIFGWVGSFIIGISLFILPRFRGIALASIGLGWCTWALWTAGVTLHWLVGVGDLPVGPLLIASALFELGGYAISQYLLVIAPARAARAAAASGSGHAPGRARDLGSRLGIAGFSGLGVTLIVNLVGASMAAPGSAAYPPGVDRVLLELCLWAFVLPIALGYSSRFVSRFLGLRPVRGMHTAGDGSAAIDPGRILMGGVAAMALAILAQAFLVAAVLALAFVVLAIWALRIFERAARPAFVTDVYRHYPAFIRIAFAWLVIGAAIGLAAAIAPALSGLAGAGRHAITVGFIALLIFSLGPRLLPPMLQRPLFSRTLMAASLWLLTIGCTMRVLSEAVAYGSTAAWAWQLLPLSGFVELTAVLIFVFNMAVTLARRRSGQVGVEPLGPRTPHPLAG
jgi:hypothetical protein